MLRHYLFTEEMSGEQFIVGSEDEFVALMFARNIAEEIGAMYNDGEYVLTSEGELTDEEAEASGLDEY